MREDLTTKLADLWEKRRKKVYDFEKIRKEWAKYEKEREKKGRETKEENIKLFRKRKPTFG